MPSSLPHRRRAWWWGVIIPALIYVAGAVVLAWGWPRLPAQVVVHIGVDGVRLGAPAEIIAVLAVTAGISYLLLAVLALTVGRSALARRMVLGLATGSAVFVTGLLLAMLMPQLDGREFTPDGPLALATVASLIAGGVAAARAGRDPLMPATEPVPREAPRLAGLGHGTEHLADRGAAGPVARWQREVKPAGRARRWLVSAAAAYAAGALWLGWAAGSWYLAGLLLAPVVLVGAMTGPWQVWVDAAGITAQSRWGWPRYHVPAVEVCYAEVTQVDPLGDFGGWGLRISADTRGTIGVIVRKGEAISVHRTAGRRFVVTVDDAPTGAAALNTAAERARR